jgi:hypothetical protein
MEVKKNPGHVECSNLQVSDMDRNVSKHDKRMQRMFEGIYQASGFAKKQLRLISRINHYAGTGE